jgi:hypothetical protein
MHASTRHCLPHTSGAKSTHGREHFAGWEWHLPLPFAMAAARVLAWSRERTHARTLACVRPRPPGHGRSPPHRRTTHTHPPPASRQCTLPRQSRAPSRRLARSACPFDGRKLRARRSAPSAARERRDGGLRKQRAGARGRGEAGQGRAGSARDLFHGAGVHLPVAGDEGHTCHLQREGGRAHGARRGRAEWRRSATREGQACRGRRKGRRRRRAGHCHHENLAKHAFR